MCFFFFFFQAEDGIRDYKVTGVQTCALPIFTSPQAAGAQPLPRRRGSRAGRVCGSRGVAGRRAARTARGAAGVTGSSARRVDPALLPRPLGVRDRRDARDRSRDREDPHPSRARRVERSIGEPAMNDIESRLAETMKARARNVEPDDETAALARITSRVDGRRNRALMVLGVAAAIALVIGAVALFRQGEDKQRVGVTATTTTVPVS